MAKRRSKTFVFSVTAISVAAFHGVVYLFGDYMHPYLWLIPLAVDLPIAPLILLLHSLTSLSTPVALALQTLLSSVFWGLVVVYYRAYRPQIFTGW